MQQAARRQLGKAELRALSLKASLWYEQHALLTEAIETALMAEDFDRAAELIERTLDPLNRNYEHQTLRHWIERLPETVLQVHPTLAFLYAVAILFTSDRRASTTLGLLQPPLQIAEEHWRATQAEEKLGAVLAFRALLAWLQGDLDQAFTIAKQAVARLPQDELQWRDICLIFIGVEELRAGNLHAARPMLTTARELCEVTGNEFGALDATLTLGEVYARQGELRQAAQLYQHVLTAAEGAQMEREQAVIRVSNALLGLSMLAYEWNDLATAEQQATQALAIGDQVAYVDLQIRATLCLARIDQARGALASAQQRLHALIARIAQPRWSTLLRRVHTEQARLMLGEHGRSDLAGVEQWAATVATQKEQVAQLQQEQEALVHIRLLLAQDKTAAVLPLLERWQAEAQEQGRTGSMLEMLILQSITYSAVDQLSEARQTLLEALRLAQSKGYQRLFLDEGERLACLLPSVLPSISDEPLRAYVQGLLTAFGHEPWAEQATSQPVTPLRVQTPTSQLIEPLSERECDVLRLVAAGLATDEIAQELVISVGTVRTHLKHIYGKLDAHSRVQAVERARAFNLL